MARSSTKLWKSLALLVWIHQPQTMVVQQRKQRQVAPFWKLELRFLDHGLSYRVSLCTIFRCLSRSQSNPSLISLNRHSTEKCLSYLQVSRPLMLGLWFCRRRRNEEHRRRILRPTQQGGVSLAWQSAARRGLSLGPALKGRQ